MKAKRFLANTLVILPLYLSRNRQLVWPAEIAPPPALVRLEQPATLDEAAARIMDAERERLRVADADQREQVKAHPAGPVAAPAPRTASPHRGLGFRHRRIRRIRRRRFRRGPQRRPLRPASWSLGLAYWVVRHASRTRQGSPGRARRP